MAWARQWQGSAVPRGDVRRLLADLTDRTLARHWQSVLVDLSPTTAGRLGIDSAHPDSHGKIALAAVGSLGRRDGGPVADLDLVLLHDRTELPELQGLAEALWYPIWDSGLDLDHSVRSLAQCRQVAARDLTALTGLLDLRYIAGDAELVARAREQVAGDWRAGARRRFGEFDAALAQRRARFGELAFLIEPNLKEARGGLRDVLITHALAAAWLADRPHGAIDRAQEYLLDVRDALQLSTGRPGAMLVLAEQDEVATALSVGDADDLLAGLADAGRTVSFALETTVRRARQALRPPKPARPVIVRGRRQGPRLRPVAPWVVTYEGETALAAGADVRGDPAIALRAAAYAATASMPLSPVTQEHLTQAGVLPTPWPPEVRADFLALLASGENLVDVWEALDQAGLITRWIPAWQAVRNRPQRTPVHRHTVDRHLIATVVELTADQRGNPGEEPLADELLIAALLHDIGKVGGGDHAEVGARIAPGIAQAMGLTPQQVNRVAILVRHHLALADAATHGDPDEPAVARGIAARVDWDPSLFEMLAALTRADARAAGPQAWSSVRASLIERLANRVRALIASQVSH